MNKTFLISLVDHNKISEVYGQLKSPFLPRVGDNILMEDECFQVLQCNIQMDQIMIAKDNDKKIVSINNPHPQQEEGLIIPVILIVNIRKVDEETPKE